MNKVLDGRLDAVDELCPRHVVRRLGLFGSVVRDHYDPERGDVDCSDRNARWLGMDRRLPRRVCFGRGHCASRASATSTPTAPIAAS